MWGFFNQYLLHFFPNLKPHGPALVLLPVVVEDLEGGAPLAQLDAPVLHGGGGHDDQVGTLVPHLLQVSQEGDRLDNNERGYRLIELMTNRIGPLNHNRKLMGFVVWRH